MPSTQNEQLDRIADVLGLSRDALADAAPVTLPADWLYVDGTPDQFEVWADQVLDPAARQRLLKIAAIVGQRKGGA